MGLLRPPCANPVHPGVHLHVAFDSEGEHDLRDMLDGGHFLLRNGICFLHTDPRYRMCSRVHCALWVSSFDHQHLEPSRVRSLSSPNAARPASCLQSEMHDINRHVTIWGPSPRPLAADSSMCLHMAWTLPTLSPEIFQQTGWVDYLKTKVWNLSGNSNLV